MLVLIAHPGIGSGFETLLRLEGRYDVRWVRSRGELSERDWPPDLLITERGAMPADAGSLPTILVVGEVQPGQVTRKTDERLRQLRKDATVTELIGAIDQLLGRGLLRARLLFLALAVGAAGFLAVGGVLSWLTLRP